jgi:hypothetical protein
MPTCWFVVQYDAKLCELMDTYDRAFLVHADNVGSKQFMDIRAVSKGGGLAGLRFAAIQQGGQQAA